MKIAFPQNIYSSLISFNLLAQNELKFLPSSLIAKAIMNDEADAGFIPSLDLINNDKIILSKKIGLAFDGNLSNSYFYFVPEKSEIKSIYLRGDITKNEIILSKILLKEKYNFEPEFILDSSDLNFEEKNYLISGMENYDFQLTKNGISLADHVADFIDYPYVNYVLASKNSESIKIIESSLVAIDEKIEANMNKVFELTNFSELLRSYYLENINSVYFDLTENEIIGLNELLRLPYYHGIIEDIIEPKFAE